MATLSTSLRMIWKVPIYYINGVLVIFNRTALNLLLCSISFFSLSIVETEILVFFCISGHVYFNQLYSWCALSYISLGILYKTCFTLRYYNTGHVCLCSIKFWNIQMALFFIWETMPSTDHLQASGLRPSSFCQLSL